MKKIVSLSFVFMTLSFLSFAQSDSTKSAEPSKEAVAPTSMSMPTDTAAYALLYVYRPANMSGFAVGFDLHITNSFLNGQVVGRVKNNSKFVVKLYQEGKTEIWAETESKRSVSVTVKYGEKYFVKCGIGMGVMVGRPQLDLVYPEQGILDYENVVGKKK